MAHLLQYHFIDLRAGIGTIGDTTKLVVRQGSQNTFCRYRKRPSLSKLPNHTPSENKVPVPLPQRNKFHTVEL